MRHDRMDVRDQVQGKWRGILGTFGIEDRFLRDRHGPCPMCEGTDRFRFDDKDGRGTYICGQCGAGDGWDLLKGVKHWDFATAAREVRAVLGIVPVDRTATRPEMTPEQQRGMMNDLWRSARPVEKGDVVDRYMTARGVDEWVYPASIRTLDRAKYEGDRYAPVMLAKVSGPDGKPATLHRTFLEPDGRKLDVPEPRKLCPGKVPPGSAIRLSDVNPILGIAEGIETAFAASHRFDVPVWAAISAGMLEQWEPPEGVEEVWIFGDSDRSFTGQVSAYVLAKRLYQKQTGLKIEVMLAPDLGKDWADYATKRETKP